MIQVFPHRKELVKYIWLHIQLPTYTEALSLTFEDTTAKSLNGRCIAHDLFMLFSILSSWDPDLCRLTLELTFQSPSDSHYAFRHLNFGGKEHKTIRELELARPSARGQDTDRLALYFHDRDHLWRYSMPRLFGRLELGFVILGLPEVVVVDKLILRRQVRRQLCAHTLMVLFRRLPQLNSIIYESSQVHWLHNEHRHYAEGQSSLVPSSVTVDWLTSIMCPTELESLFRIGLPQTLRDISLFQDCDQLLSQVPGMPSYLFNRHLAEQVARRSLGLRQLHISYLIDAVEFIQAYQRSWAWHHLESIALTSPLLTEEGQIQQITMLLYMAGQIACAMPKLKLFAL